MWRPGQLATYRTANVNEYSTRYSEAIDAKQQTSPEQWRVQSRVNKQGSGHFLDTSMGSGLTDRETELHQLADTVYRERLEAGVAREQARKDLPLSTYTEAYWKIDLHNLFHFLALRMDAHAQHEIRSYANAIGNEIVAKWVPIAWEAFVDYRLEAMQLSRLDQEVIKLLVAGKAAEATEAAKSFGWISSDGEGLKANRERVEFETKATALGLTSPWL